MFIASALTLGLNSLLTANVAGWREKKSEEFD